MGLVGRFGVGAAAVDYTPRGDLEQCERDDPSEGVVATPFGAVRPRRTYPEILQLGEQHSTTFALREGRDGGSATAIES